MEKKYMIALDEGTTSVRSVIFDHDGKMVAFSQKEFPLSYPHPGWVEMNASEVYSSQYDTLTEVVSKSIHPSEIAAIAISNQRETTIVWDKKSGDPISPGIVWQCRRTSDRCEDIKKEGKSEWIREKTGLIPDAYFSASKLEWMLDNIPGARKRAEKGELLFGTVDTWLLWKLTNGAVHATDRTNASRTMLYNIHSLAWDQELLDYFNIPKQMLPEVRSSGEVYGYAELFGEKIPISGMAGDQQAALFGQKCFDAGEAKCTYGTGCFLLLQTGEKICRSTSGLVSTIAASENGMPVNYALEGSVFVGGAIVQWLRDNLGILQNVKESEFFALQIEDNEGVYIVPAFAGLGAPYWDMYARGTIVGLTGGSNKNHLIRAALESIAYQSNDLITAMEKDIQMGITSIKADGGASLNQFLMQFQADISNAEVVCETSEATALGAALLGGLAVGFWKNRDEIRTLSDKRRIYQPNMSNEKRKAYLEGWKNAVERTRSDYKGENK